MPALYPCQPGITQAIPEKNWLSANAFSELAGISQRMGQKIIAGAFDGRCWKEHVLTVRSMTGAGGHSGRHYQVLATSLPQSLVQEWITAQTQQPEITAPITHTIKLEDCPLKLDPLLSKRTDEALWRLSVIQPILAFPRYSPDRASAIHACLQRTHLKPDGTHKSVSQSTLYAWLVRYEQSGLEGLTPRQRNDAGKARTLISRMWDKACPLEEKAKLEMASRLRTHIRSLWSSGVTGWRTAQQLASSHLAELSRSAGWQDVSPALCGVTRSLIEAERHYQLVACHDQDAKHFFDYYVPRIRRSREGMQPMDVVVGDVHPIDIAIKRPDGSLAYPRAIAWLDVATNRLFFTLILLRKGEGIKQTDIVQSFASLCAQWGLCKTLYLDNGSEYANREMLDGFLNLTKLMHTQINVHLLHQTAKLPFPADKPDRSIIHARPYNAPAKPIEGLFSLLEQRVFAMIPGWVGGNRMKKKTHNIGREPLPYPGTWDAFQQAIEAALTFYHHTPQQGSLHGQSPYQAYEAAIAQGWGKILLSEQALLVAFAATGKRRVRGGYLNWNGTEYYHDALLPYTGSHLTVHVARHDPRFAFVFHGNTLLCAAEPASPFGFLDIAGAKEQYRRTTLLTRAVTARRQHTNRLDLVEEMHRHNQQSSLSPDAPVVAMLKLPDLFEPVLKIIEAAEKNVDSMNHNLKPPSQWHALNEYDPYLTEVEYSDDGSVASGIDDERYADNTHKH